MLYFLNFVKNLEQLQTLFVFIQMEKRFLAFFSVIAILGLFIVNSCNRAVSGVQLDVTKKAPELLSAFQFFKGDMKLLQANDQVIPYDLASPLFTDYASKSRFVYVPSGKTVAYNDSLVLNLPVGSCYIKNFYYPFDLRDVSKGRRIMETRLLVHRESGWENLDYIWKDDQSDAVLDVAGDVKQVSWIGKNGENHHIDYIIPNKNQCKGCHWYNNAIMPIGPKVANLNHEFAYSDGKENQLLKWKKAGVLTALPELTSVPKLCDYNDHNASLDDRARAYLESNCAHCHNPHGPAYTSGLFLNYRNTNQESLGFCKTPVAAGRGTGGLLIDIVPGDPEHSILYFRMASLDAGIKMPELGRSLVHQEGLELIGEWIKSKSGTCKPNI